MGSLDGATLVFSTTSSWSILPTFFTAKATAPRLAVRADGRTLNSFSRTATVVFVPDAPTGPTTIAVATAAKTKASLRMGITLAEEIALARHEQVCPAPLSRGG